jgi:valyl-tRNA synthetase
MDIVQEYGSDALRLGIIGSRGAAQNQAFSKGKVTAGRNFANKLWNIARFIEGTLDDNFKPSEPKVESLADHWIVRQLNRAAADVAEQLENYRFAEASETVYHAIWDDVADWYVESAKKAPNPDLMAWVLQTSLKIAHPFAPFVTETIWQTLDWSDELLISSAWPTELECSDIAAGEYEQLQALVMEARYVTAELPGNKKYGLLYRADSLIADNAELIQWLARLAGVEEITETRGLRLAAGNREAWLDVDSETLYEHQTNLEKRLSDTRDAEINLRRRLENPKYVNQAPEHLVEETRQQLAEKQELIKKLQEELEVLN